MPIPSTISTILSKYRITGLLGSSKIRAWIILTPLTFIRWNWDNPNNSQDAIISATNGVSGVKGQEGTVEEIPATHLPDVVSDCVLNPIGVYS